MLFLEVEEPIIIEPYETKKYNMDRRIPTLDLDGEVASCKCSHCGNIVFVHQLAIGGDGKFTTWCMPCDAKRKREIYAAVKGRDAIEHRSISLLHSARDRASKKELPFNITREFLIDQMLRTPICPALLQPIRYDVYRNTENKIFEPFKDWVPSVQRTNPDRGYTLDNVCILSFRANTLLNNATAAELELLAKYQKRMESNPEY